MHSEQASLHLYLTNIHTHIHVLTYPHTSTHTLAQLLLVHYHQSGYKLRTYRYLSSDEEWNGKSLWNYLKLVPHCYKTNLQAQLEKETKETDNLCCHTHTTLTYCVLASVSTEWSYNIIVMRQRWQACFTWIFTWRNAHRCITKLILRWQKLHYLPIATGYTQNV